MAQFRSSCKFHPSGEWWFLVGSAEPGFPAAIYLHCIKQVHLKKGPLQPRAPFSEQLPPPPSPKSVAPALTCRLQLLSVRFGGRVSLTNGY